MGWIDRISPPVTADGCWLWVGYVNNMGYGQATVERRTYLVHRLSWERAHGPIPDGMCVCHRCDTPRVSS